MLVLFLPRPPRCTRLPPFAFMGRVSELHEQRKRLRDRHLVEQLIKVCPAHPGREGGGSKQPGPLAWGTTNNRAVVLYSASYAPCLKRCYKSIGRSPPATHASMPFSWEGVLVLVCGPRGIYRGSLTTAVAGTGGVGHFMNSSISLPANTISHRIVPLYAEKPPVVTEHTRDLFNSEWVMYPGRNVLALFTPAVASACCWWFLPVFFLHPPRRRPVCAPLFMMYCCLRGASLYES